MPSGFSLGGIARADTCEVEGEDPLRIETFAGSFLFENTGYACDDHWVEGPASIKTYCDGELDIDQPTTGTCHFPDGITCPPAAPTFYHGTCSNYPPGGCCNANPAEVIPSVECETLCPPSNPPCCKGADCSDCKMEPYSIPSSELAYTLAVFPTNGGGFPAEFDIFWRGRSLGRVSRTGPTLGPRAAHSFAFFLTKAPDSASGNHAHVTTENGDVASFTWTGSAWSPENGRKHTLSAGGPTTCSGSAAIFTEEDGTILRFNDYCGGTGASEGRLVSSPSKGLERPNGDFVEFTFNGYDQIASASNRLDEVITFSYSSSSRPGTDGYRRIHRITSPSGAVFQFGFQGGLLSTIQRRVTSSPETFETLWTLATDPENGALYSVRDSRGKLDHVWTYATASNGTELSSEAGPDLDPTSNEDVSDNAIAVASPTPGTVTLSFDPPGSDVSATNTFSLTNDAALAHVTSATVNGSCPNCGLSESRIFWSGRNVVRAESDANGTITAYEDFVSPNAGNVDAAYTPQGMPKVVNRGCTGTLAAPSCGHRETYSYVSGTDVIASMTTPSVVSGQVVTRTRTFAGTSTRVALDSIQGRTASSLGGTLSSTTRSTSYTYGGGADGIELTKIEGPYTGTYASTDPRTDLDWYTDSSDVCGLSTNANNTNRLKWTRRWVNSSRYIETRYCNYNASGLPQQISVVNGATKTFTYNWRGQVTSQTDAGTSSTTNFTYDAAGNLTSIKQPTVGTARVETTFAYDDADRLIKIAKGSYQSSSFTEVASVEFSYDNWGNRTMEKWFLGGSSTPEVTQSAEFNALGRLVSLARPASSSSETLFEYDDAGNVASIGDGQGDGVSYGSGSPFVAAYDQMSKITRLKEGICDHPSDPDAACTPTDHVVEFDYDDGLNLEEVRIPDGLSNTLSTQYVTDDFGDVVSIDSPDDGGPALFRYDAAGRLVESRDHRQATASPASYSIQYSYDRVGRLTEKKSSNSALSVKYCYDGYNAACGGSDLAADAGFMTAVNDQVYSWTFDYDSLGHLLTEKSGFVTTRSYSYGADGRVLWERLPNGLYLKYTHNGDGSIASVAWSPDSTSAGTTVLSGITYGARGELRQATFSVVGGGGVTNRLDWNLPTSSQAGYQSGRIRSITLTHSASGVIERLTYGYADDGTVKEVSRLGAYSEALGTIRHDSLGRITKDLDTGSASWGTQSFTYDDAGNRRSRDPQAAGTPIPYTYTAATNKLTAAESLAYGFDAAGNIYTRVPGVGGIGYDELGRVNSVTTASGTTTFSRDFRNHRISKAGVGGIGSYRYNDSGEMIQWTGPGSIVACGHAQTKTVVPYENFVYVGGRRLAMIKSQGETACGLPNGAIATMTVLNRYVYFGDLVDLPRAVYTNVKVWTANFDSFANPIAGAINENPSGGATFTNSHRLPGQFNLGPLEGGATTTAGGLHENWHRVYDSVTGRYLEPDAAGIMPFDELWPAAPFGVSGGMNHPYGYAAQQPLAFADVDGGNPIAIGGALVEGATLAASAAAITCLALPQQCKDIVENALDAIKRPPNPTPAEDPLPVRAPKTDPKLQPEPLGPDFYCDSEPKEPEDCATLSLSLHQCLDCCEKRFHGTKVGLDQSQRCQDSCNVSKLPRGGPRQWKWPWT